jgi:porin
VIGRDGRWICVIGSGDFDLRIYRLATAALLIGTSTGAMAQTADRIGTGGPIAAMASVSPRAEAQAQPAPAPAPAVAEAGVVNDEPLSLTKALGVPGVAARLDLTGFVGALAAGDGPDDARFTGRADLFVDVSSKGLGLWDGTILRTHTELRASDTGAGRMGGALWPQNTAALLPLTGEGIEVTSIYVVQSLGAKTNLLVGKINAIDLLASDPFFGGWGTKRFQNIAFVAPPSGVVPPTIMGTILTHQAGDVGITAMVFDPEDRTGDYWVDGLFSTGVNGSLGATWKGQWGGRETSIALTAAGSTSRGLDFEDILGPPGTIKGTRKGSYNIALQFGHDLAGSAKAPSHVGVYLKAAIADGNPNPIEASVIGGFAGHGLFKGRSRDRWGLGFYFYDFSDTLQDAAAPLAAFDDEAGVEAWYSFAITANADIALNAQVIDPATARNDVALVLGARLGLHF